MTLRSLILPAAAICALTLAGCGKQSDLERPAPMWGAQAQAEYAKQRAEAEAKHRAAVEKNGSAAAPGSPQEIENPANAPRSTREAPLPGAPKDPF